MHFKLRIFNLSIIIHLMIIDFHTHVVPPSIRNKRDEFIKSDACFALLYSEPKAKLATVEDVISNMDECGIDKSVILNLSWENHDICVKTNDYILESIARYPQKLGGFCAIQPLAGEKAIIELERCIRGGACGIGEIRLDFPGFNLKKSDTIKPIMQMLIKHDLIFLIHASEPVGHQYSGKGNVTPDVVYPFILDYPELKLVCAHWGGGLPFYALMPEVYKALENVFFDTAATPFLYKHQIFNHVVDILGSDKILFGSDYPLLSPKRIIDQVESTNLRKKDKEKILGSNAEKLLASKA